MRIREILTETSKATFRLHPALNPENYQITGSLRDHAKWKARTYLANNGGEIGNMQEVGYVMISLVDDTIIPISRDDEHHMGKDLLYDLAEGNYPSEGKKRSKPLDITPENYVPIWPQNNYIYQQSDAKVLLPALTKFLAYGGNDGTVVGTQSMRGRMMHFSDFVATKGELELTSPGELAPLGKRIYGHLSELAEMITAADDQDDRIKLRPIFLKALELCRYLASDYTFMKLAVFKLAKESPKIIRDLQKANDLQGLREFIFGFDGIKNTMHRKMKDEMKSRWGAEDMQAIWGDPELAIDMLARL